MLKNVLKTAALAGGILVPGVAAAAAPAIVTTDLNFRTGPSTSYQAFDVIPDGGRVTVHGCLSGYNWCDISWAGNRGWVSGNYLAYQGERYYRRPISSIGISIGLPVIGFDRYDYQRRWYAGRPWWDDDFRREVRRDRRDDRREWRQERREDRREIRAERRDVRDARRDVRQARQELRQERRAGGDITDERRDLRQARRALREERRELRRERRDG